MRYSAGATKGLLPAQLNQAPRGNPNVFFCIWKMLWMGMLIHGKPSRQFIDLILMRMLALFWVLLHHFAQDRRRVGPFG